MLLKFNIWKFVISLKIPMVEHKGENWLEISFFIPFLLILKPFLAWKGMKMALKIIRQGQLKVSKSIMSQNEYILLIDFPIISIICKKSVINRNNYSLILSFQNIFIFLRTWKMTWSKASRSFLETFSRPSITSKN